MTDREGNVNLSKNVFGNQEIKSWSCLGQTCERYLIVFLSQLFYDFADYLCLLLETSSSKTCDEPTVWVERLCSVAGYILLSARL